MKRRQYIGQGVGHVQDQKVKIRLKDGLYLISVDVVQIVRLLSLQYYQYVRIITWLHISTADINWRT